MYYEREHRDDGTTLYADERGNWVVKNAKMETVERGTLPAAEVAKENTDGQENH